MGYVFSATTQALLASGKLVQVVTKAGQLLPIVRDPVTGRFVEIAKFAYSSTFNGYGGLSPLPINPLQPLIAPTQSVLGVIQMVQVHRGFQAAYQRLDAIQSALQMLQGSVGVLQATTALIGVGTVAGVALSAVNLYQTLQLREDIRQLRLEVKDGFIDLKKALKEQGQEIIGRIDRVAEDVEFKHHRAILVQAYGLFAQAMKRFQSALAIQDLSLRNSEINDTRSMLFQALSKYDNPHLLEGTCAPGQLRRQECVWAIEQAVTTTFQAQEQYGVVSDRLSQLQAKIHQDALQIIDACQSDAELDFIFPELVRIRNHDLSVIQSWQQHVDWVQELSPDEQELLVTSELAIAEPETSAASPTVIIDPVEQQFYDQLKSKSHFHALRDQLKFAFKPDLRQDYEAYISQQAPASGYKALVASNWQEVPDLTVANLYWYFRNQEHESK